MIKELQSCSTLNDLSQLLGFKAQNVAYIIYKIPEDKKYGTFSIPKKTGGERQIHSPNDKLKLLQRRLANILYECHEEIFHPAEYLLSKEKTKNAENEKKTRRRLYASVSHGYEKSLSIATNAYRHTKKRYVYNTDLKDFFPSINFGRVRGFFIKDRNFNLKPNIATIIAQIACHQNQLPQGSPCSPIISNLIARKLDYKITLLAKKYRFDYTRYVDDITISTNISIIPTEILELFDDAWVIGQKLKSIIEESGFIINTKKGRMQYKDSRQEVTGVIVNKHVNTPSKYYRMIRAALNSITKTGSFHLADNIEHSIKDINKLHGAINHIYHLKSFKNIFANEGYRASKHDGIRTGKDGGKINSFPLNRCQNYQDESHIVAIDGIKNLYNKFLFFKYFAALKTPLILCEGKTDNTYLKCAIEALLHKNSLLKNTSEETKINFFNRTKLNSDILKIAEGVSGLGYIVDIYQRYFEKFNYVPANHPVIIVVDNDTAGRGLIEKAKSRFKTNLTNGHAYKNLYIIRSSETEKLECIEDLFDTSLLNKNLGGKKFNYNSNNIDINTEYGKEYFARNIVKHEKNPAMFSRFPQLLERMERIIRSYNNSK